MNDSEKHVTVIAEAGVNHNGNISTAKKLIDAAAAAGADYVKFQTFKAERLVSKEAQLARYQSDNLKEQDNSQFSMLKKLELSDNDHKELIQYCENKEIHFLSTAFDVEGLMYLNSVGLDFFKIPSGEITNYPYLRYLSQLDKPLVLSTGMANLLEIREALDLLYSGGVTKENVTVLHCNTEYPTPYSDVNLKAMTAIQNEFEVKIGYSDHTLGIEVPVAAVALGATVIEKHFTLDRSMKGPDHKASLEPDELKAMVTAIRHTQSAISGSGIKKPSLSEKKNISIARKSIHLAKSLKEGSQIKEDDLIALRPGNGISPMEWNRVIGAKTIKKLNQGHQLSWEDLSL